MDLNCDGNTDVLSGSYSRMESSMAGLFQVLLGKEDGTLAAAEPVTGTDGEPLIVTAPTSEEGYDGDLDRICTRPVAVDWDGDGDLDLLTGNFGGTFSLFRGEGGGKFQPTSEQLMVGDDVLRISGYHSDPFCIDWDGDGDLDLLSGSTEGGVQIAENTAGPDRIPKLSKFRSLIEPGEHAGQGEVLKVSDLKAPTRSTRIWIDDVNEDGKLDIFVGDSTTLCAPVEGLTEEQCRERQESWTMEMEELSRELSALQEADPEDEEVAEQQTELYARLNELYQIRSEFIREDRTGFVWLYLHK